MGSGIVSSSTNQNLPSQEVIWFRDWINKQLGVVFKDDKLNILENRLLSLTFKHGYSSIAEIKKLLIEKSDPYVERYVTDMATTNHTHFYREIKTIEMALNYFYPEMHSRKETRIWSAASSTGDELYTITLMLIEKFGLQWIREHLAILGTDVNSAVIDEAEDGIYPSTRVDDVPPDIKSKYFKKVGVNSWQLHESVRSVCLFRRLNLKNKTFPFQNKFHIIFLRNVLYYFEAPLQQEILHSLYAVAEPGCWLVTSVTESFTELEVPWIPVAPAIYRKEIGH